MGKRNVNHTISLIDHKIFLIYFLVVTFNNASCSNNFWV